MEAFASEVPEKVRLVVVEVMLSELLEPLSSAAAKSGVDGAAGAVASMVTERFPDATPVLPAASVALAFTEYEPAERFTSTVQLPEPSAVVEPPAIVETPS